MTRKGRTDPVTQHGETRRLNTKLDVLSTKRDTNPHKKHGNFPLQRGDGGRVCNGAYLPVSIFRLIWNDVLLSKELMVLVGLFLPFSSAQSS